jgi:hypothetical protein
MVYRGLGGEKRGGANVNSEVRMNGRGYVDDYGEVERR